MHMRLLPIVFCFLGLLQAPAQACECLWQGSFADVQAHSDLVVSAKVVSTKGNSIDLQTESILRGSEPATPLRVWLQREDNCRPEVSEFPVNSRWVFALHRIRSVPPDGFNPSTPNLSYGRIDDFTLSSCGGYWLKLKEDFVTGNLINAARWDREPKMSPVLLDLVAQFVQGALPRQQLLKATREDPALRDLMLDTRSFLRSRE